MAASKSSEEPREELERILKRCNLAVDSQHIVALVRSSSSPIKAGATGDGPLLMVLQKSTFDHIESQVVVELLENGCNPNERNHAGETPLHRAVFRTHGEDTTVIEALIRAGADINARNVKGRTPLHEANLTNTTVVEYLIECGANLEAQDCNGESWLLSNCSFSGHARLDGLEGAIALGASIHARDLYGRTILHTLIRTRDWEFRKDVLHTVIAKGASARAVDFNGNTLLHASVSTIYLRSEEIDTLLALGLDVNARNILGRTPLHLLCSRNSMLVGDWDEHETTAIIFDRTNDLNSQDLQGITPLHLACTSSEITVRRLLRAGADASIPTYQGLTCLHLAARAREANILGLLLEHLKEVFPLRFSELVNFKDSSGRTPLHYACRSGREESAALLLDAGADLVVIDHNDRSPLWTCLDFEEEETLWNTSIDTKGDIVGNLTDYGKDDYILAARGLMLEDRSRPPLCLTAEQVQAQNFRSGISIRHEHDTARLNGMLDTLKRHATLRGLTSSDLGAPSVLDLMRFNQQSHVLQSFLDWWDYWARFVGPDYHATSDFWLVLATVESHNESLRSVVRACGEENAPYFLTQLLCQRQLEHAELLIELHPEILSWIDPHWQCSNMHLLVAFGFADVLRSVANCTTPSPLDLYAESLSSLDRPSQPLLFVAVQREMPNMDVVRFLVETINFNVNEVYEEDYRPPESDYDKIREDIEDSPTVLHYVSRGKQWWHAGQCLPYLLSLPNIDIEARNKHGQTPLLLALAYNNIHSDACAKRLIECGADVRAVDKHGKTCLALAEGRSELTALLRGRGST